MSNILITPAKRQQGGGAGTGLGTGPFTIASADSGTGTYRLVRNENYWGEQAKLDEVNVSYQEEEGARVIAITSGQTDVIDTITPESAASLKTNTDIDVIETPGHATDPPLLQLPQAGGQPARQPQGARGAHLRDRPRVAHQGAHERPGHLGRGRRADDPRGLRQDGRLHLRRRPRPSRCSPTTARPASSCAIIWEDSEFAGASRVLEAVSQMFAAVGVTAELKMIPKGGDINAWRRGEAGDWDILANGYGNQTGLALTNLQGQYGGTAEKEKTRDTYHGFVVPEITALLDQAAAESDEAKRNDLLKQAQEKIWAQWPAMWAWTPNNVLAKRKRVTEPQPPGDELLRPRRRDRLRLIPADQTKVIPCSRTSSNGSARRS